MKKPLEENCVQYFTRQYEMWVEGTADEKPTEEDILKHAAMKNYFVSKIDIWFDDMQGFWRFNGNLHPLTTPGK